MTALVWEKLTDDGSIHDKHNTYTWEEATSVKIAALNAANYAGHNDWRFPTKGGALAAVGSDRGGFQPSSYWSSSTPTGNPTLAWSVSFYGGWRRVAAANTTDDATYVRAVRGGA